jgi:hypothetical protein
MTPAELVIEVTADDIRLGVPGNVCRCPVAIAAVRALGGDWAGYLAVEEDIDEVLQVSLYASSRAVDPYAAYPLPDDAAHFVGRFDDGEPVEPLTFTARRIGGPS